MQLTKLSGIRYFTPSTGYFLRGRDGMVSLAWDTKPPIPLLEEDYPLAEVSGAPDYDMVGRGIYQALRSNPGCNFASEYAAILKDAYPHIISDLGGQIIMLEAKEVDSPYLDRKINFLRIMSLVDPGNAGIHLEIARTCTDKGSRLATLHQAVDSWYAAETWFIKACELDPANPVAIYELGEVLYVLGRYQQAAELWQSIAPGVEITGQRKLESRIAAILAGRVPRVPPVDYLTALAVAVEEHQAGHNDQAVAIIEDVLADAVFEEQFPLQEIYYLLGTCYQEMGLLKESAEAFTRS